MARKDSSKRRIDKEEPISAGARGEKVRTDREDPTGNHKAMSPMFDQANTITETDKGQYPTRDQ